MRLILNDVGHICIKSKQAPSYKNWNFHTSVIYYFEPSCCCTCVVKYCCPAKVKWDIFFLLLCHIAKCKPLWRRPFVFFLVFCRESPHEQHIHRYGQFITPYTRLHCVFQTFYGWIGQQISVHTIISVHFLWFSDEKSLKKVFSLVRFSVTW